MKYKLIIFDLDNTVFDYNMAESYALDETLSFFDCPISEAVKENYRIINEQTWQRFERGELSSEQLRTVRFEKFGEAEGFSWDAEEVSSRYLENLGRGGFLLNGAEELVKKLSADFRLAALTNGIADVQHSRIENSPLKGYFDPLVISDEVGAAKPNREIFEILFEKAGVTDKRTALMIGDSLSSDIAGCNNAGIDCCWYNPDAAPAADGIKPDYVVGRLSDFIEIAYKG